MNQALEKIITKKLSLIVDFFKQNHDYSLADLHQHFKQGAPQISNTLNYFIYEEIKRLYGANLAHEAITDLKGEYFYTAHHGGIENHPQLIASNILALGTAYQRLQKHTHIAFVCNATKKNNSTIPCGFLSGKVKSNLKRADFFFTGKTHNSNKILYSQKIELNNSFNQKVMASAFFDYEKDILKRFSFKNDAELFTDKAALNNTIALNSFMPKENHADALFIDYDVIAKKCIINDLSDKNSFMCNLFSDHSKLYALIEKLCKVPGCWGQELIHTSIEEINHKINNPHGTILFYAIAKNGTMLPLHLIKENNSLYLATEDFSLELTSLEIKNALCDGSILPGPFLSYISLIFGHNMFPAGGIYMQHYLGVQIQAVMDIYEIKSDFKLTSLISSCILPVAVIVNNENLFNRMHPLSSLDLRSLTLDNVNLLKLLNSKLEESKIFTYADIILDNFDRRMINDHYDLLLKARSTLPALSLNCFS